MSSTPIFHVFHPCLPTQPQEPKALATARSWVESAAKNLPPFEGALELGPQQFASTALRVYCDWAAAGWCGWGRCRLVKVGLRSGQAWLVKVLRMLR